MTATSRKAHDADDILAECNSTHNGNNVNKNDNQLVRLHTYVWWIDKWIHWLWRQALRTFNSPGHDIQVYDDYRL